jgi:hypothetical protein
MQTLHSLGALVELRFCMPPAPALFHGAGIFSATKLSAQPSRSVFMGKEPDADAYDHHYSDSDD